MSPGDIEFHPVLTLVVIQRQSDQFVNLWQSDCFPDPCADDLKCLEIQKSDGGHIGKQNLLVAIHRNDPFDHGFEHRRELLIVALDPILIPL